MRAPVAFLAFAAALIFASTTFASSRNENVDLAPLADFFRANVRVLEKPVHVFNYMEAEGPWQSSFSADDPAGFQFVESRARAYWEHQGEDADGNMMGRGFYAASDSASTRRFGGRNWVLTRIEFPRGLRFIDTTSNESRTDDPVVRNVVDQLGCNFRSGTLSLHEILAAKPNASAQCLAAIKLIVDSQLEVDALTYNYGGTHLNVCNRSPSAPPDPRPAAKSERRSAFVIMSSRRLNASNVRIFNAQTRDASEERLRIESLFYRAAADSMDAKIPESAAMARMHRLLSQYYPDRKFFTRSIREDDGSFKMKAYTCDRDADTSSHPSCQLGPLPPLPGSTYPTVISSKTPSGYLDLNFDGSEIMWADFEGVQTDLGLDGWAKTHLFGCDDVLQHHRL